VAETQQRPSSITIMTIRAFATKKRKFEPYVPVISRFCGSSKHIGGLPDYESTPSRSAAPSPPGEFPLFSPGFHRSWACQLLLVAVAEASVAVRHVVIHPPSVASVFVLSTPFSRVTQAN
jgi:hypothetical protein